jgi:hypothetical protein
MRFGFYLNRRLLADRQGKYSNNQQNLGCKYYNESALLLNTGAYYATNKNENAFY